MKTLSLTILAALAATLALPLLPAPVAAQAFAQENGRPPGLRSAELLPVATLPDGRRMTALVVEMEEGWKTYWRSPGDSGMPPGFDWTGSTNLRAAEPLWPAPEVILSGSDRTLGYHDALVLPVRVDAAGEGPVALDLKLAIGLCKNVCVPARLHLVADEAGGGAGGAAGAAADPRIAQALARVPVAGPLPGRATPACTVTDIPDGVRVAATLPGHAGAPSVAMELMQDGVWVSQPELVQAAGGLTATADFVPPEGKPFPLDLSKLRMTVIGRDAAADGTGDEAAGEAAGEAGPGAVEYQGCAAS